tara:strand:+ start:337 stop:570 length:234 start_codon:yes stop_codon:yes gene_type:complete
MATKNDITGDSIKSKGLSKQGRDNWDKIFGKKEDIKVRKTTPDHGSTKVHKDKSKYDRKSYKDELRSQSDLNWDGND